MLDGRGVGVGVGVAVGVGEGVGVADAVGAGKGVAVAGGVAVGAGAAGAQAAIAANIMTRIAPVASGLTLCKCGRAFIELKQYLCGVGGDVLDGDEGQA